MKVGQDPEKKKQSPISKYKRMNPWSMESFLAALADLSPIERERKRREEEKQKAPWKENIREMTALDREALGWHAPIYWRPGEGSPIDEGIPRNILTLDDEGELAYLLHPKKWSESLQRMVFDYDKGPIGILKIPKDKPPSGFEPILGPDGVIEYIQQDRSDRQYIEPMTGARNIFSSFEWYDAELQAHIDKHGWPSNYPPLTEKQKDRLENARGRRPGMPSEPYHEFTNMPRSGGSSKFWPYTETEGRTPGYRHLPIPGTPKAYEIPYREKIDNPWFDRYLED